MRFDFHTHGKLAKKLPFSPVYTHWLFSEAKEAGLDGLCLTEHFNTLQFQEVYQYIASQSQRKGDMLLWENGLCIFPGMETDVAEGGHILSIGPLEAILEANRQLEPYKEKGNFLPFAQLMKLLGQYPLLVGCGHPYREGGHVPELPLEQLSSLAFLDLNGKDLALQPEYAKRMTYSLGNALQIPVVSGSDTHQAVQYGCVYTQFQESFCTIETLHRQMQAGAFTICQSPDIAFRVKTACMLKKSLKEIHRLGGDYVSILTGENVE